MDCAEIEGAMIAGGPLAGPETEAHLTQCPACRYLVGDGAAIAPALAAGDQGPSSIDLAALERTVLDRLRDERGALARLRESPRGHRLLFIAVVVGLEALFMYSYVRRSDWGSYPGWRMALTVGAYGMGAALLGWASLRPVYLRPLSPRAEWAILGVAVGLPFLVAVLPAESTTPSSFFTYPRFTFRCFAYGSSLALPVILVARLLDRGGGLGRWAAATAIIAGGYAGLMGLQMECPINYPLHLLTGHATVPLLLLVGSWLLRKT